MIEHGTNSCYQGRRCRRPECVEAHRLYHREYHRRKVMAQPSARLQPADRWMDLLTQATVPSATMSEIAAATGIPRETLYGIRAGRVGMVEAKTFERLAAWFGVKP